MFHSDAILILNMGCRGSDRMVVRFTTI